MRLALFICLFSLSAIGGTFYVATNGNDSWSGTLASPNGGNTDGPFLTLPAARNASRIANPQTSACVVYVEQGNYIMDSQLFLTNTDSGSLAHPMIYSNYPGHSPILIGGHFLTTWSAVTNATVLAKLSASAQTNVVQADVSSYSISPVAEYGYPAQFPPTGWKPVNELYFNQIPMTIARYPNGETNWLLMGTIIDTNKWTCTNTVPYTWLSGTSGLQVVGYIRADYAFFSSFVTAIDTNTTTITVDPTPIGATRHTAFLNQRYFFQNLLSELDSAGEYYIDRTASNIYFWPPTNIAGAECLFGTTSNLLQINNASNIQICGLTFEGTTKYLATVAGSSNIAFGHCTLRNCAGQGLYVSTSPGSGIDRSTLYGTGQAPVYLDGGDRTTLTPGSNYANNCTIHDYARLDRTYQPGVHFNGVGITMAHNLIYNCPHSAILGNGNDNLVEYNHIHDTNLETADAAAIYINADWTMCGNVFRFNYIHDVHQLSGATDITGVIGIYFDAALSGNSIYGNCFNRIDKYGIFVGGGRSTIISNNCFASVYYPTLISQELTRNNGLLLSLSNKLVALPYNTPPWSTKYPFLSSILTDPAHITLAMNDVITTCTQTNAHFGAALWTVFQDGAGTNVAQLNNYASGDALYVNYPADNFRLQTNSPLYSLTPAWTDIPYDLIGPLADPAPPASGFSGTGNFTFR
jgi:hypothetical protein